MTTAVEPQEHAVEARGLRFHYVEWGDPAAPAMVVLHGLSSHCRIWDPFARVFAEGYRIVALDQRGHGDTSWPEAPDYATDDYVGDLEALVDAWGLGRFVLAGQSMGGMNSIAYAVRHPDRVTHVIAVDIPPAVDREKDPMRGYQKHLAENGNPTWEGQDAVIAFMRTMAERNGREVTTPDGPLRHRLSHLLKPTPEGRWLEKQDPRVSYYWRPADLWDELPKVAAPALILRGGKSQVLPDRTAERMRAAFPRAELVTVEEAGHTVVEDRADEFIEAVRSFLERYAV